MHTEVGSFNSNERAATVSGCEPVAQVVECRLHP